MNCVLSVCRRPFQLYWSLHSVIVDIIALLVSARSLASTTADSIYIIQDLSASRSLGLNCWIRSTLLSRVNLATRLRSTDPRKYPVRFKLHCSKAVKLTHPKVSALNQHSDYRPISITSVLARTLEKLTVRQRIYTAIPTLSFSDKFAYRPTGCNHCSHHIHTATRLLVIMLSS